MGSYYIPSDKLKGESRILLIFTPKSLIFTAVGALIGFIFYLIFSAMNLSTVGVIIMVIFALIGYALVSIKIPANGTTRLQKNVGGLTLCEIIVAYYTFKKNRKLYNYSAPLKETDYMSTTSQSEIIFDTVSEGLGNLLGKKGKDNKNKSTKEEKK